MRTLALLPLALSLTGCAAVLGTKQKDFNLNSAPPGAEVYLNGNRLGTTPVRVKLSNQATHTFVFRREGYHEATCTLNRGTGAGWVILDVVTGLVPIIIDAATGSWSQTKGDGCNQSLDLLSGQSAQGRPSQPAPSLEVERTMPAVLMDDVPSGTNWIANAKTRVYYRVGCPVTSTIPSGDRLYYGSETSLQDIGFTKSEECSASEPAPSLTLPPSPAAPPIARDTALVAAPAPPREVPVARRQEERSRSGFWISGGLGYGSLGCDDCNGREGALSGGLALGGALSQKVALGVGTTGWYKSENGVTLSVGTLTALIRFYPSLTGGFFLLGGLGLGSIHTEIAGFGSRNDTGLGVVLGLGYDVRIGRNVSLTPFWNGFAVRSSEADANVGQIGLGVTVH